MKKVTPITGANPEDYQKKAALIEAAKKEKRQQKKDLLNNQTEEVDIDLNSKVFGRLDKDLLLIPWDSNILVGVSLIGLFLFLLL